MRPGSAVPRGWCGRAARRSTWPLAAALGKPVPNGTWIRGPCGGTVGSAVRTRLPTGVHFQRNLHGRIVLTRVGRNLLPLRTGTARGGGWMGHHHGWAERFHSSNPIAGNRPRTIGPGSAIGPDNGSAWCNPVAASPAGCRGSDVSRAARRYVSFFRLHLLAVGRSVPLGQASCGVGTNVSRAECTHANPSMR